MANFKIKQMTSDDKLGVKVMGVSIGRKEFITPYKALNSPQKDSVLEIYQNVNAQIIDDSRHKPTVLDNLPSKCKDYTVNMIVPCYTDVDLTDKDLCDLESRIHPHTDVVIVPRWEGVLKLNNQSTIFDDLWSLSNRYVQEVRRINGKLIMGNLPLHRPQSVVEDLIDSYIDNGVTSFLLDYEQCNAPTKAHIVRNLEKKLVRENLRENSLLYSVNMKKSHDFGNIKPADDLLSFITGVDILGNYHLRGGGGNEELTKIFNREEWTYVTAQRMGRTVVEIALSNHMNMNVETEHVKNLIFESGTAAEYIRSKRGATEYTRAVSQTTLDVGGVSWS